MQDGRQQATVGWSSVKRRSLADEVTDQLRDFILTGQLRLATGSAKRRSRQRLRVSRGPVREAIVRLEQEGLVDSEWHKGAAVVDLTRGDVIELATLRVALEKLAIAGACRSATEEDLAGLRRRGRANARR